MQEWYDLKAQHSSLRLQLMLITLVATFGSVLFPCFSEVLMLLSYLFIADFICKFYPTISWSFLQVEAKILGEVQDLPKGLQRENKIIQTIMRQLLFALDGLHSTGIVHRDIKPQNVIFSEGGNCRVIVLHGWIYLFVDGFQSTITIITGARTFKIIDLGAATDLRVGINYIPKEFLLDPR